MRAIVPKATSTRRGGASPATAAPPSATERPSAPPRAARPCLRARRFQASTTLASPEYIGGPFGAPGSLAGGNRSLTTGVPLGIARTLPPHGIEERLGGLGLRLHLRPALLERRERRGVHLARGQVKGGSGKHTP